MNREVEIVNEMGLHARPAAEGRKILNAQRPAPEATVADVFVVPEECAIWSTTVASPTVESPEYSIAATPTSAADVVLIVIVGRVPAPALMGALHTLISVPSEAL